MQRFSATGWITGMEVAINNYKTFKTKAMRL